MAGIFAIYHSCQVQSICLALATKQAKSYLLRVLRLKTSGKDKVGTAEIQLT